MKHIKTFKIFESGIRHEFVAELKKEIEALMDERYSPNTNREIKYDLYDENPQDFKSGKIYVNVFGNESKYGKTIEVEFFFDPLLKWGELNEDFRQPTIAIDIIDAIEAIEGVRAQLIGFNVFRDKQMGQKDGRSLQIEDMMDKFTAKIDSMDPEATSGDYTFLNLWFLAK